MANLTILPHFKPFLEDWTHVVCLDPRGTGKSVNAHRVAVYFADNCRMKVLCLREFQNSIADSSKSEIEEAIYESGTQDRWEIQQMYIKNKVTGSIFMFRGVNAKPKKLKSLKGIDLVISEECEDFTAEIVSILIPTVSRNKGASFWWLGNVGDRNSFMNQYFVENEPPPNTIVLKSTYLQNPYLPIDFIQAAEHLKRTNEVLYRHVYLGEYIEDHQRYLITSVNFGIALRYPNDICVIGVDIAREGGDRTVFTVRIGKNIVKIISHASMTIDKLVMELNVLSREFNPDYINVDSTGHGAWVPDALKASGIVVHGVCFSEKARSEDKYKNKRTELYGMYSQFKEAGGMIAPIYKEYERGIIDASRFTYDKKDRPALVPKEEYKTKSGVSSDIEDSIMLSLETHGNDMFAKQNQTQSINAQSMVNSVFNSAKW